MRYSIDGNIEIEEVCRTPSYFSIISYVHVITDSSMTVTIPRNVLCYLMVDNTVEPIILVDGVEVEFNESNRNDSALDFTFELESGSTQIEIVRTFPPYESPTKCLSPQSQLKLGISVEEIACDNYMIRMKKISDGLPICVTKETSLKLIERGYSTENPMSFASTCKSNGGKWLEQYYECESVSEQVCKTMNGNYRECGSMCRHEKNPDDMCPMGCIQLCTAN